MLINKVDCYTEINEVLKLISEEDRNKIPQKILLQISNKAGINKYSLQYNKNGQLILLKDTESMLLYLYYNYIISDNAILKNAIDIKMNSNQIIDRIIKERTEPKIVIKELFPQKTEKTTINEVKNKETSNKEVAMVVKKENIITKIINIIKNVLKTKN